MACTAGITNSARVAQLILRDPTTREDLIVLDVLPHEATGAVGLQGITLGEDLEGLYRVPTETPLKAAAYQEGCTPSRFPRRKERRPKLNLHTQASSPEGFIQVETLLWSVLSTDWDCWIRLLIDDGTWRELRIRLMAVPDRSRKVYGVDTAASWELDLLSWDPFWYSAPYEFRFTRDDQGAGLPHMTPVAGGYEIDVPITNPTDQLGFASWNSGDLVSAEQWSFQDGEDVTSLGAPAMVHLPQLLPSVVKRFLVQTYPTDRALFVKAPSGPPSQQWARMRGARFTRAYPANTPEERTVRVRLVGGTPTSTMMLTLPRRWDRPFGGQLPVAARMIGASL